MVESCMGEGSIFICCLFLLLSEFKVLKSSSSSSLEKSFKEVVEFIVYQFFMVINIVGQVVEQAIILLVEDNYDFWNYF